MGLEVRSGFPVALLAAQVLGALGKLSALWTVMDPRVLLFLTWCKSLSFQERLGRAADGVISDPIGCPVHDSPHHHHWARPPCPVAGSSLCIPRTELVPGLGAEWEGDGFLTTNQGKYMETIMEG